MKKLYLSFILILIILLAPDMLFSQQYTEETSISLPGIGQGSLDWGDYNNDGFPDILMSGELDVIGPSTIVYKNNGDNTFTEQPSIILEGVFNSSVKWADLDNDGDLDILITGTKLYTQEALSKVYRNDSGSFNEVASGLPGIYLSSVAISDHDRDGDLDILMTGMQTTGERISAIFNNNGNFEFTQLPGTSFTKVCNGYSSFGDFDNDGYPDVLISGETATLNRISKIYHNNGNGAFTELTNTLLSGLRFNSGAWADFNGDGFLDIILSGEDAGFSAVAKIYQNTGNGGFSELTGIALSGGKYGSVACGDYDNDGDQDIFISGDNNNNPFSKLFTNNGTGTFSENSSISISGLKYSSLGLSDFDNDGDLDFLVTGQDKPGNLWSKVYKNNATTANIRPVKPLNLNATIDAIDKTTVTLTWDRVSGDETSSNSISYNVRAGLAATSSELVSPQSDNNGKRKVYSVGNSQLNNKLIIKKLRWNTPYSASVQAIDNSYSGSEFSTSVNFSTTPLQPTKLIGTNVNTTSILLKWKRGNGDRCILFAREGAAGTSSPVNNTTFFANSVFGEGSPLGTTGWYCIFKGDADSVLLSGLNPEKNYTVHAIEFQGTTGSEIYATVTNPENDNIGVFSPGIFTALSGNSMPGLRFSFVAWGDYNNDDYLDILITGRDISGTQVSKVFSNNRNNTFTDETAILLPGVENGSSAWGDYNNDDLLDIILTGYNPDLGNISRIYLNNGNNTFSEQTGIVLSGVSNSSVVWMDYDNDGYLDLLITGAGTNNTPISKIYHNDKTGGFTEQTSIVLPGVKQSSVASGDYDNDGWLDILLTGLNTSGQNISKIYRNNGNHTFSEQTSITLQGVGYGAAAWGDYDNDNYLDILIAGASGYNPEFLPVTNIYHNNGNNTFTLLPTPSVTGINNCSAEWGDYNNDGLLDILLIGDSGLDFVFKIYLNNGNDNFTELSELNLPGGIGCSSSSADYDNDGDLDILFSGYSGALLSEIYRNNLNIRAGIIKSNLRPEVPTGLISVVAPRILKLTWDGIKTDETFFVNMSYNIRCKLKNAPNWMFAPQASESGSRSLNDMGNAQLNRSYTINDPVSGTYEWQVQAVDQSYSGSEWSAIETVIIKTTQAFFKTDTVCNGLTTTFTDQSVATEGIATWKWDFKDGSTSAVQNPVHTYASAGTYKVKLLITSGTGQNEEKDSLIQDVIVKKRPTASFSAPTVCIGAPTVLTNTTNLNGLTASNWLWNYGDGQSSAVEQPGTHNYAVSGTFQTKLKTVATNGCSDSIIKNINVARYPESSISVAGDFVTTDGKLTFCDGLSLQLTAKSDPFYTYQWRKDANNWTGAESNTYNVNKTSGTGIYDAIIINTLDNANCKTFSEQKAINIKPTPVKPVIISDNYISGQCIGANPIKLKVDQATSGYNYGWARNEVALENSNDSFIEGFPEPGNFTVTADLNGCFAKSNVFQVTSQGAPDKPILFARGPNVWYIGCNIQTASKYKWYYNGNLIAGAQENYYVANQNLGTYFVRIGNSAGCYTKSDELEINYLPSLKKAEDTNPFSGLKIYPNPSPGMFNLEMDNELFGDLNISIISQGGKEILRMKIDKSTTHFSTEIDLSGQTRGAYFIKFSLENHSTTNQIIIE